MGTVISIMIQKGGNAKTTTASSFGHKLADYGYKVLLIDMDAQRDLTLATSDYYPSSEFNIYTLLTNDSIKPEDVIISEGNLDLLPSHKLMATYDKELIEAELSYTIATKWKPEYKEVIPDLISFLESEGINFNIKRITDIVEPLKELYDFIIIDTPPALNKSAITALEASDEVIIPLQAESFSEEALNDLFETIDNQEKEIKVAGILLQRYNKNTSVSTYYNSTISKIAEEHGTKVYKSTIREATKLKEALASSRSIFKYAKTSNVANDYTKFVDEYIKDHKLKKKKK